MANTKVVLLNAAPRSGKDVTANELIKRNPWYTTSFKKQLLNIALTVAPVSKLMWDVRYEEDKDVPWELLGGLSQREFLIKISEGFVKTIFGEQYFGKALAKNILEAKSKYDELEVFIISDSGFNVEVEPLIKEFGEDNVLIVQWSRNGCSFDNDSRDWVDGFPSITQNIPNNNGTIEEHVDRVECCIKDWLQVAN